MTVAAPRTHRLFSPTRIQAIAGNTFTQLVRMKVFYFLLIFFLLLFVVGFGFTSATSLRNFAEELSRLRSVAFGAMTLFSSVFAIIGTSILIPTDIADRTLYTILCKPVPRMEYLLGKLLGVLALIAASLMAMTLVFGAVLWIRQTMIAGELSAMGADLPEVQDALADLRRHGLNAGLLQGVAVIFLKAAVAASLALLVSTFASSTLFTIVVSLVVYFIGHVQYIAREAWFPPGAVPGAVERILAFLISILFPDFQMYNAIDGIVAGETVPLGWMLRLCWLTVFYMVLYQIAAWFVFANKEL